jgi:hypothetical protein
MPEDYKIFSSDSGSCPWLPARLAEIFASIAAEHTEVSFPVAGGEVSPHNRRPKWACDTGNPSFSFPVGSTFQGAQAINRMKLSSFDFAPWPQHKPIASKPTEE